MFVISSFLYKYIVKINFLSRIQIKNGNYVIVIKTLENKKVKLHSNILLIIVIKNVNNIIIDSI